MGITLKVSNFQEVQEALKKALDEFRGNNTVLVGIHEAAGNVESGDLTMAKLGAIHEFGADIDHPGGTSYGYASQAAYERNEVRFLGASGGTRHQPLPGGYIELGVTGPHKITIPARPWLVPGVQSGTVDYLRVIEKGVKKGDNLDMVLERVGIVAVGNVQQYMTDLKTPPNAPSTIAKKGSSNPLIDSGAMRASVTYSVSPTKPSEGLE